VVAPPAGYAPWLRVGDLKEQKDELVWLGNDQGALLMNIVEIGLDCRRFYLQLCRFCPFASAGKAEALWRFSWGWFGCGRGFRCLCWLPLAKCRGAPPRPGDVGWQFGLDIYYSFAFGKDSLEHVEPGSNY
jgi:hypothetical protein